MNLILSRKSWFIYAKCANLPEADNSVVTIYLFSFAGRNWSMRTFTIPLKELSLYDFKNSCLKALFFLSTLLFVLTEISSSPCRNARTHSLKTGQLYKLTLRKHLISIKSHQYRETMKWKPPVKRVCYLRIKGIPVLSIGIPVLYQTGTDVGPYYQFIIVSHRNTSSFTLFFQILFTFVTFIS